MNRTHVSAYNRKNGYDPGAALKRVEIITPKPKPTRAAVKILDLLNKSILTEEEIKRLNLWLNHHHLPDERTQAILENDFDTDITQEQTKKGIEYLRDQMRTPEGKERKNNPFSSTEMSIIDNFNHFKFIGFKDTATDFQTGVGIHYYKPIWRVYDRAGRSFDYYWAYGVHIV